MKLYSKKPQMGNSKEIIWDFSLLKSFCFCSCKSETFHHHKLLCRLTETRKLNRRQLLPPTKSLCLTLEFHRASMIWDSGHQWTPFPLLSYPTGPTWFSV